MARPFSAGQCIEPGAQAKNQREMEKRTRVSQAAYSIKRNSPERASESGMARDCVASTVITWQHTRMEFLWDLFHRIYDVESLVRVGGIVGLTAIVFVETGLLVGFFLPGDSL